jgi:Uma2 family endonuclease
MSDRGGDDMAVQLRRRRFTLEQYHRMGEAGILDEDDRVELIEGEIIEMTPIGPVHASVVARLTTLLVPRLGGRAILWPQNPLALARQTSEFQPDLVLLRPKADFYRSGNPGVTDALLVIEVMDTSVVRDRRVKLPIYARAGAAEVWLIDVNAETVEMYRRPTDEGYGERREADRAGTVAPAAFPEFLLPVAEILG